MDKFPRFPLLPAKIRHRIWLFTIPEDEEEVCLTWPGCSDVAHPPDPPDPDALYDVPTMPLTVDTGFPRAMHVCRDSRRLVQDSKVSGVLFRTSHVAGCMTPFRHFRPDLDILYLDEGAIRHLGHFVQRRYAAVLNKVETDSEAMRNYEEFRDILGLATRLAMPIGQTRAWCEQLCEKFRASFAEPESLDLVLPYSVAPRSRDFSELDRFLPPGKRCHLVPVSSTVDPDLKLVITANEEEEFRAEGPKFSDTLGEAVQDIRFYLEHHGAQESVHALLYGMVIEVKVFVEYQRDGTWREVCRDRMVDSNLYSYGREYTRQNKRSDPDLVRVQDIGVELVGFDSRSCSPCSPCSPVKVQHQV